MFSFNVLRVALSVWLCVREFFLFSILCVFPFHTSFYVLHVPAAAASAVAAVRISACLCLHSFSTGGKLFDDCQYCVEGGHNGAIAFIGTSQAKPSSSPRGLGHLHPKRSNRTHFVTRCRRRRHLNL